MACLLRAREASLAICQFNLWSSKNAGAGMLVSTLILEHEAGWEGSCGGRPPFPAPIAGSLSAASAAIWRACEES